jgi:hypothetical protein
MNLLSRFFGNKDQSAIEFKRSERLAIHANESQNDSQEEAQEMAGRAGYFIHDPQTEVIIAENPALRSLWLSAAPIDSLININRQDVKMLQRQLNQNIIIAEMNMADEMFNRDGYAYIQSFRTHATKRNLAALEGFTAKAATQSVKVHTFREEKEKK